MKIKRKKYVQRKTVPEVVQPKKPLRILGIDQALDNTGLVLTVDGKMKDYVFYAKSATLQKKHKLNSIHHKKEPSTAVYQLKRLFWLIDEFRDMIEFRFMPDIVVMENYAFSTNSRSTYQIGELGGQVHSIVVKELGKPLYICEPTKLKKFATGNGTATKTMMIMTCLKKHGIDFSIFESAADNLCDAFWMAIYGTTLEWIRRGYKTLDEYPSNVRDTLNAPSLAIAGKTNIECGPITPEMVLSKGDKND